MDINMKDILLVKDIEKYGDWVMIKEEGTPSKYTKLLVDDGKYSDSTQLGMLQTRIQGVAKWNDVDSWEKLASSVDWFTTNVLSAVGAKSPSGLISSLKPALTIS